MNTLPVHCVPAIMLRLLACRLALAWAMLAAPLSAASGLTMWGEAWQGVQARLTVTRASPLSFTVTLRATDALAVRALSAEPRQQWVVRFNRLKSGDHLQCLDAVRGAVSGEGAERTLEFTCPRFSLPPGDWHATASLRSERHGHHTGSHYLHVDARGHVVRPDGGFGTPDNGLAIKADVVSVRPFVYTVTFKNLGTGPLALRAPSSGMSLWLRALEGGDFQCATPAGPPRREGRVTLAPGAEHTVQRGCRTLLPPALDGWNALSPGERILKVTYEAPPAKGGWSGRVESGGLAFQVPASKLGDPPSSLTTVRTKEELGGSVRVSLLETRLQVSVVSQGIRRMGPPPTRTDAVARVRLENPARPRAFIRWRVLIQDEAGGLQDATAQPFLTKPGMLRHWKGLLEPRETLELYVSEGSRLSLTPGARYSFLVGVEDEQGHTLWLRSAPVTVTHQTAIEPVPSAPGLPPSR